MWWVKVFVKYFDGTFQEFSVHKSKSPKQMMAPKGKRNFPGEQQRLRSTLGQRRCKWASAAVTTLEWLRLKCFCTAGTRPAQHNIACSTFLLDLWRVTPQDRCINLSDPSGVSYHDEVVGWGWVIPIFWSVHVIYLTNNCFYTLVIFKYTPASLKYR